MSHESDEADYYYRNRNPHEGVNPNQYPSGAGPANPRGGMNPNQYDQPIGPQRPPSAMDRIVQGAKAAHRAGAGFAQEFQGTSPRNSEQRERQQYTRGMNRDVPAPVNYGVSSQGPPVNEGSVLHPGNRLYVIEGSMLASGGRGAAQGERRPRAPRRVANPGFGNDPGL